jgi:hypothetical protein
MWVSAFLAVLWVRQGGVQWPKISFASKTKTQAKKKTATRKSVSSIPVEKVDSILEKISKEGMGSLTAAEKKLLEETRAKLLQKDRQIPPVR